MFFDMLLCTHTNLIYDGFFLEVDRLVGLISDAFFSAQGPSRLDRLSAVAVVVL